jgi:hypothetical protein
MLVIKVRKEIIEKRLKAEDEIKTMTKNNASGSAVIKKVIRGKRRKIEQDGKKETRVIVMVVANSVVNFILRVPEILVFISSDSIYNSFGDSYFIIGKLSSVLVSISYLFYILTFTINVVIYYLFNVKFKQLFVWWKSNVKQK